MKCQMRECLNELPAGTEFCPRCFTRQNGRGIKRPADEVKQRIEAEKNERAEQERIERKKAEEERLAQEKRLQGEQAAKEKKLHEERLAKEKKLQEERLAKEKLQEEQLAREKKLQEERLAKEKRHKEEQLAKEKKSQEERLAEQKRLQEERLRQLQAAEDARRELERKAPKQTKLQTATPLTYPEAGKSLVRRFLDCFRDPDSNKVFGLMLLAFFILGIILPLSLARMAFSLAGYSSTEYSDNFLGSPAVIWVIVWGFVGVRNLRAQWRLYEVDRARGVSLNRSALQDLRQRLDSTLFGQTYHGHVWKLANTTLDLDGATHLLATTEIVSMAMRSLLACHIKMRAEADGGTSYVFWFDATYPRLWAIPAVNTIEQTNTALAKALSA